MTQTVHIYQPSRTAMQSGRGQVYTWLLDYAPLTPRTPSPLMGWSSAKDTLNQVRLRFKTKQEAIAFAERKGWCYQITNSNPRHVRPKTYVDNFDLK